MRQRPAVALTAVVYLFCVLLLLAAGRGEPVTDCGDGSFRPAGTCEVYR